MNKKALVLPLVLLLTGCAGGPAESSLSSNHSEGTSSSSNASSSSSSAESETSSSFSSETSFDSSSSSGASEGSSSSSFPVLYPVKTIAEIKEASSKLDDDSSGESATVYGTYLKKIYDNGDMLMLILEGTDYLYIRFSSTQWTTHVNNIYFGTALGFRGRISKKLGQPEIVVNELLEKEITECAYDLEGAATLCQDIADVYSSFKKINLSNKYNGRGEIVSFDGQALASDRDDSNKKVVLTDGYNSVTVIGNSKLLSKDDTGNKYRVIGSLSIDRSAPAVLALSFTLVAGTPSFDSKNATEVLPSYFSKWNTLTDHFSAPSLDDYGKLYKTTCYIGDDTSRTDKYYLGAVDTSKDTLSDVGVSTSIKGFYLMNELNLSETALSYSAFYTPFVEAKQVSFVFSLYKFETGWHGWKMFAFEPTVLY